MPDHHLTDEECGQIVRASLDPNRVLGGPEGHDGGPADVLLTTVEQIVARHRAEAAAEALQKAHDEIHSLNPPAYYDAPQYREGLIDGHGIAAATCLALADHLGGDDA